MSARQAFCLVFRLELSTAKPLMKTLKTEVSIHVLGGTYLDQGLTMVQTLKVLHKAVELVPELEAQ